VDVKCTIIQKIYISIFISALLAFSACTFKETKDAARVNDLSIESTYSSLQAKVFTPKCVSCHSGPSAPHGVLFNSYNAIVHNGMFPPLVVPGNPESSSLYHAIANGSMPKGQAPLSPKVLDAIYNWIKNGAKETEEPTNPTPSPTPPPSDCSPGEPGCDEHSGDNNGGAGNSSKNEPCDRSAKLNEPGIQLCIKQ
jgi:hypothetical protein